MADTTHFDQAASTWDLQERRVLLAQAVAAAIAARIPLTKDSSVLDFGCGTGLVTLALAPQVGVIAGADTSAAMLQELASKARAAGMSVPPVLLRGDASLGGPYDLIVSSMTLHHVEDVPALLERLARHLRPGGRVALADLDLEDGSFHDPGVEIAHRGFAREGIASWLIEAGFTEVQFDTAAVTRKGERDYPVFLATARLR